MMVQSPDPGKLCDASNAILLVIDVQGKLADMVREPDRLKGVVHRMLQLAGLFEVPVVLTEQYPRGLGPTVPELRAQFDALASEKHLLTKNAFGCCGEPAFNTLLEQVARRVRTRALSGRSADTPRPVDLIVVGMETHVCVQQTVLELLGQGYRVVVLADGVSGRSALAHDVALQRFRQCGAVISVYESVAFEWTRTKEHPSFKAMSAIIKQ